MTSSLDCRSLPEGHANANHQPHLTTSTANEDRRVHTCRGAFPSNCPSHLTPISHCGCVVVTARVTTLKGPAAGQYYVEKLPAYYLDAGEPRGIWHGVGAEALGLEGPVQDEAFLALLAGADPRQPDLLLGRRFGEASTRGFDVTASAPKSVSVLWAVGDDDTRTAVLDAHDRAVGAMVGWIEDHATTRFRVNGDVVTVDAQGIVAASFRQHTSRALDPQLHTHVVIPNRVLSPDGRWLALDARTLKVDQRTVSSIYHSVLRSELTNSLGVEWREAGRGIGEIAGVPDRVLDEFSVRTGQMQHRLDVKLDRFEATYERAPNEKERWRLEREAAVDSRPTKVTDVDSAVLHREWAERFDGLDLDPQTLIRDVTGKGRGVAIDNDVAERMATEAVVSLSQRSVWRRAEVTRELAAALPWNVNVPPAELVGALERLTDLTIKAYCIELGTAIDTLDGPVVVRRDGRPITEAPTERLLSTQNIVDGERFVEEWAERRLSHLATDDFTVGVFSDVELSGPQLEVAAAVAGDAHLTLVVGPAGTGKTTALQAGVRALQRDGRPVFGVAPSAAAADVLGRETGVSADTVDKLLHEHFGQRPPDHRFDLPTGTTVIIDEVGMVPTDKLEAFAHLSDRMGWRVAMVGDPLQFAPVGRGGMFDHFLQTWGGIELDTVHRFRNEWERTASLQLRRSNSEVLEIYAEHGRLHGGTGTAMRNQALNAWTTARENGVDVILAAPTQDKVNELNRLCQAERLRTGELSDTGRHVTTPTAHIRAGDEIVTRRNNRTLTTDQNVAVRNRDRWTVEVVHRNGDLTATGDSGTIKLPADYVAKHVELGYAQTSHAVQGRTVDHSILVLDGATDARGIYVPMTRGRHVNEAFVTVQPEHTITETLEAALQRDWIDRPAITHLASQSRPGALAPDHLREMVEELAAAKNAISRIGDDFDRLPRRANVLDSRLAETETRITQLQRRLTSSEAALAELDRPLKRHRNRDAIDNHTSQIANLTQQIGTARNEGQGHASERSVLRGQLANTNIEAQQLPGLEERVETISGELDTDRRIRTRQQRHQPSQAVTDHLGHRPTDTEAAKRWDIAAGRVDQHQAAHGITKGLGVNPLSMNQAFTPGHELTWRAATQATQTAQAALQQTIEGPSRSRGMGISR